MDGLGMLSTSCGPKWFVVAFFQVSVTVEENKSLCQSEELAKIPYISSITCTDIDEATNTFSNAYCIAQLLAALSVFGS